MLLVAGCRQLAGLDDPLSDGVAGASCAGSGDWELCLTAAPSTEVTLPATIVTSGAGVSALCLPSTDWAWSSASTQPDACVIASTRFDVTTPVRATGALPLVLVALDTITISAALDVASVTDAGAGSVVGPCPAFAVAPSEDTQGGGGGAGGDRKSVV